MKLILGICALDQVATTHYASMLRLCMMSRFYDPRLRKAVDEISILVQQGNIIPDSRRAVVEKSIEMGATHLWFIDSDIVVHEEILLRLIGHHKDVVCATYNSRYNDHRQLGNRDMGGESVHGLLPMSTVPLGCALIKLSIFERLERPWFNYELGPTLGKTNDISEDSWFCRQCKRAGIRLWMDPSLKVGHVGMEIF